MVKLFDSNRTNDGDESLISEVINDSSSQAIISVMGSGITAFANINNTVGGNLTGRKSLRIYNRGKTIIWRINGELTGDDGEEINKGEAVEFEYGENIVIELKELNAPGEINVIITESK